MVISCLTAYAIAFSCVTLLIGRSYAATPVQMDVATRTTIDRRGAKIQFHNHTKSLVEPKNGEKTIETEIKGSEGSKVLQSVYSPSNWFEGSSASKDTIGAQNESHSFFALYDPVNKVTRKLKVSGHDSRPRKGRKGQKKGEHPWNGKIQNFVAWDTLQDSEQEVRVHYNGITAKETIVKTGIDEETGKRQGLRLRQLTDGTNFIQLIYTFDDQIQDCEYIRQRAVVDKFLSSFKDDVEKAKTTYEIENEDKGGNAIVGISEEDDDDDDYVDEDEGRIERYWTTDAENGSNEFEGENVEIGNEYRNVTFQIVRREEDLPEDVSNWMNYQMLKRKCKENHGILKRLAYDKRHGDESVKKMAEEHIERMKRGIEFSLIFPGTKWCGKSHVAEKYTELGGFSRTDKCCRAHDHCHPLISAFEERYGFYNFRPFTVSHCRCDLRKKRDLRDVLMVPGTKWCGKGRRATKYTSLGGFSRTDKCCRVHDTMCPYWIGSLEEKYGLFNWRINTIMHCRCDKRFRACLKMAKTGTANFVGKLFFNVVQTKCFILKPEEVCLKYSWWGKCEKKEYRKKAYLKDNLSY